jgi:outer membrane protein assembly factor BamB
MLSIQGWGLVEAPQAAILIMDQIGTPDEGTRPTRGRFCGGVAGLDRAIMRIAAPPRLPKCPRNHKGCTREQYRGNTGVTPGYRRGNRLSASAGYLTVAGSSTGTGLWLNRYQTAALWLFWFAKPFCVEDTFRGQILTFVNSARFIILWVWLLCCGCSEGAAAGGDWPMFRGGPALAGVAGGSLPARLEPLWTFKAAGPVKSSAAIVQERVFIGSDDGNVYALALADGKKVWAFKTGGAVESSPLVLEGRVFVGSSDGWLYALEAGTGKLAWKYETGDKILGAPNWVKLSAGSGAGVSPVAPSVSPAVESSRAGRPGDRRDARPTSVLVGSYDFKLHCVDAGTGKSNWVYETGNYINGSPAVANGQAVFGGCDGLLHVISLADGKQVKEVEAGAYIPGSVALADGRAYFGQYENEFLCVDLKEGKRAWTFKDRSFPYFSAPAVTKEVVVFGGQDKLLHCVKRADGKPVWSFPTRGKVDSAPVICGGKVIVGSDDGRLYVVSLDTGKELWSYEVGQPIESSPAVAEGTVVIGSNDGNVYCFGRVNAVKPIK